MRTIKFLKFAFGAVVVGLLSMLALQSTQGKTEHEVTVFGSDQVYADVPGGDGDVGADSGAGCDAGDSDCDG